MKAVNMVENIRLEIEKLLAVRETTLKNLHSLKEDIEESYDKSRKAKIGGTTGTITGSVLGIVGFALAPFTFGTSLTLTIAGATIAAAGGATLAGADLGYYMVSKGKVDDANTACGHDRKSMEKLKELGEEFVPLLDWLAEKYNTSPKSMLNRLIQWCKKIFHLGKAGAKGMYYSYKLIKNIISAGKIIGTKVGTVVALRVSAPTVSTSTATVQAGAKTVWSTMSTSAKVLGAASVIIDVVMIPVNLGVLAKASYDVHKYKQGISNSTRAKEVQKLITDLEKHRDKILAKCDSDGKSMQISDIEDD